MHDRSQGRWTLFREGLLQLATVGNDDRLGGLPAAAAVALDLLDNVHAFAHMAKHNMLACRKFSAFEYTNHALKVSAGAEMLYNCILLELSFIYGETQSTGCHGPRRPESINQSSGAMNNSSYHPLRSLHDLRRFYKGQPGRKEEPTIQPGGLDSAEEAAGNQKQFRKLIVPSSYLVRFSQIIRVAAENIKLTVTMV